MASVSGVRRLPKGGFRACRPGFQTARRGIGIGGGMQAECPGIPRRPASAARGFRRHAGESALAAECRRGVPGFRADPGVPPGRMASVSAAKVPQSRRAGAHRAAGGFAADLPRRAGAGRGFRGGGRAYRRQKSVPGRASRWRQTSEPGYHPHRLRYGTEIPLTKDLLRGAGSPTLPDQHHPPRKSVLLGGRRSASHPRARKTSDLPPGIGISIGPSILTSTKQQNNKTTQQQNRTTGNQKVMNSGRQDFTTPCR